MNPLVYNVLILLAIFGLISLIRRRFESKQLIVDAAITLVVWAIFLIVLAMLYVMMVAQVEY